MKPQATRESSNPVRSSSTMKQTKTLSKRRSVIADNAGCLLKSDDIFSSVLLLASLICGQNNSPATVLPSPYSVHCIAVTGNRRMQTLVILNVRNRTLEFNFSKLLDLKNSVRLRASSGRLKLFDTLLK